MNQELHCVGHPCLLMLLQEAIGKTWVLYDMGVLTAMLICLITFGVYVQSLREFSPQNTYEVYDSLGAAQARLLLPKKNNPTSYNGEHACKRMCGSRLLALEPARTDLVPGGSSVVAANFSMANI